MFCLQSYTQYIPLSVYDLQTWMGSPSIYVYDCSNAGIIIELFRQFSLQRESELEVCMWAISGLIPMYLKCFYILNSLIFKIKEIPTAKYSLFLLDWMLLFCIFLYFFWKTWKMFGFAINYVCPEDVTERYTMSYSYITIHSCLSFLICLSSVCIKWIHPPVWQSGSCRLIGQELYSVSCLWSIRVTPHESWTSCWSFHFLPHNTNQNCS